MPRLLSQMKPMQGKVFGKLTVVAPYNRLAKRPTWLCRCECGSSAIVAAYDLNSGSTKSCGCLVATQRGASKHPLYQTWHSMHRRCTRTYRRDWKHYGDRGLSVCERWHTFQNFVDDMGPKPSCRHTIERIDNDRGYEPGNCRWAISSEQTRNRRTTRTLEYNGERLTLQQWADLKGLNYYTLWSRVERGWPAEQALSPVVNRE